MRRNGYGKIKIMMKIININKIFEGLSSQILVDYRKSRDLRDLSFFHIFTSLDQSKSDPFLFQLLVQISMSPFDNKNYNSPLNITFSKLNAQYLIK